MNTTILEHKIGFDTIREKIKALCSTNYARDRVINESFSTDYKTIEERLSITDELRVILMFEPRFPQSGFTDCTIFLKLLDVENSSISLNNLRKLNSFSNELRQILNFIDSTKEGQYPTLKKYASSIKYFAHITQKINTIIDKNGEIKDNASEELLKICKGLQSHQNSVSKKIESILKQAKIDGIAEEDANISIHDGKLLIPVSAHNKRSINGIVQGESASGKTFFVEPIEVVEINNKIKELEFEKEREIARILFEFTDFIRPYLPELVDAAKFVGEVDFAMAKAMFSKKIGGGKPILSQNNLLNIKDGRHPVLESVLEKENKKVVPLNLELTENKHILIISGPNAGGKSVCLKTVGILQYMFQWGVLVPCSAVSEFPIFDKIFIDIGDEQSIEDDLSTYSSHLINMKQLLQEANFKSLVLIDEFGSGTEPTAGGAIAETILEEIEKKGVYGVITTHYTNLKVYAENSDGVINGAMLFDSAKIQPLYKLEIGIPGNSFAFDLARKIGLNEQIVKKAEEKAGESFIDLEKQLRKVSKNRRKLEEKLTKIKFTDKNLEEVTERYFKELSEIKQHKKDIIQEAKKEAQSILDQANKEIEATIKKIKETQAEKNKTKQARENLKQFSSALSKDSTSKQDEKIEKKIEQLIQRKRRQEERKLKNKEIKEPQQEKIIKKDLTLDIGCSVKVKGKEFVGKVISLDNKWVTIAIGEISSRVKIEDVEVVSKNDIAASKKKSRLDNIHTHNLLNVDESINRRKLSFKPEIDIRGERLNDALDIVSRFIDDALMVGATQLRILHGKGSGVLKEEIRKYLKTIPSVERFTDEDVRLGGSGITIVYLS